MPANMRVTILTKAVNYETLSNFDQKLVRCLQKPWSKFVDPGNDQLATFRYELKRLTSRSDLRK